MDATVQQPNGPDCAHRDEREWETMRWAGQLGKTGGRQIFDGRFDANARKSIAEERTDR